MAIAINMQTRPATAQRPSAHPGLARSRKRSSTPLSSLLRIRYSILIGVIIAVMLPVLIRGLATGIELTQPTQYNSAFGGALALVLGVTCLRKLQVFPGIAAGSYIFISFSVSFSIMAVVFLMMRIEYSRAQLFSSYLITVSFFVFIHLRVAARERLHIGVVPSERTNALPTFDRVDWVPLHLGSNEADLVVDGIIADLHRDHDHSWETQITRFILSGIPVYHYKQALEQLSGRVEIYHLSENTLGSLNPNGVYLKVKSMFDAAAALVLLVLASPVLLIAGLIIRLESPGPVLFRQQRTGFRGQVFTVYKLRTMHRKAASAAESAADERLAAMTKRKDPRITAFGTFLRRTRLDELPQLLNVVKGEMSIVGPRPEATSLTSWYEAEIPFYHYRHLIKPGLTGWAQINQGHVTDVADVREKLYLDFYYVKNFSFWLDLVIAIRTTGIIVSGRGAR